MKINNICKDCYCIDDFIDADDQRSILIYLNNLAKNKLLSFVNSDNLIRKQRFYTIFGKNLLDNIKIIKHLYFNKINLIVNGLYNNKFLPLNDLNVGASINITPKSGSLSYHYDRNEVTAILYLTDNEDGALELFPNHRLLLLNRYSFFKKFIQRFFDLIYRNYILLFFKKKITMKPKARSLLIMQGSRNLHRVLKVEKDYRIAVVLCFDREGLKWGKQNTADYYGYNAIKQDEEFEILKINS